MATFSLKANEAKSGKGKVITWNKADDFMIVEIGGAKKAVHKSLGERLIAQKKATKAEGELVDNTKAHREKVENLNGVKK